MTKPSLATGRHHPLLRGIGVICGMTAIAVACRSVPPTGGSPAAGGDEAGETVVADPSAVSPNTADAADEGADAPATDLPTEPTDPVSPQKQDCGQLTTQSDINACARANYAVSDRMLNQVYQTLQSSLLAADKSRLTIAEQAWIEFRDAQCEFERNRFEGGSIAPLIWSSCLEHITDQRIEELRAQAGETQSYAVADTRLNQTYQSLREVMDETVWPSFQAVQLDWLAYRDANCAYEAEATLFTEEQCLARMTGVRTVQLEQQLEQWQL